MLPKPLATPRKIPKQERAQATVQAIFSAAAHILTEEGYDKFTTNRVAELAGLTLPALKRRGFFHHREPSSFTL